MMQIKNLHIIINVLSFKMRLDIKMPLLMDIIKEDIQKANDV